MGHMRTMWNHHGIKSELLSTGGGLDSGDVAERTTFYLFFVIGLLLRKQFEKVQLAEGF